MFEEQYNELWTAVDMVAERIRTLGYPAPGTYSEFAKLTSIEEVGRPGRHRHDCCWWKATKRCAAPRAPAGPGGCGGG